MKSNVPNESEDFVNKFVSMLKSYAHAVDAISSAIDGYFAEFGEPPPEDMMKEIIIKVVRKFNVTFDKLLADIKEYKITKEKKYNEFILKYATGLYKSKLKYMHSKKDASVFTKLILPKINQEHIKQIADDFDMREDDVEKDIKSEFLKIQDYAGLNENAMNENSDIAKSVYQYGISRGIKSERNGNSMVMYVTPTNNQMKYLRNKSGEFMHNNSRVSFKHDPHEPTKIKFTWDF